MSIEAIFRPTFTDLRAEVERRAAQNAPADEITMLIDQFLAASGDSPAPLVEYDGTVTWLYRNPQATTVAVVGDIIGYNTEKNRMTRLPNCDLFYLTTQLPLDAQVEYIFAVDNPEPEDEQPETWNAWLERCMIDPLNVRQIIETHPLRPYSLLAMPGAQSRLASSEWDSDGTGHMETHIIGSAKLANWRRVWVYTPHTYTPDQHRHSTLYLLDGEAYMLSVGVTPTMDQLISLGEIGHMMIVFVEHLANRPPEQESGDTFVTFLADELIPWIDSHYATWGNPRNRVIGGATHHGTLALYAALTRPDVFGRLMAQSPTPGLAADEINELLDHNATHGFNPPACYVDVGRYESTAILDYTHMICSSLLTHGAAISYQEYAGDHSFAGWRTTIADVLSFHFGTSSLPSEIGA